LRRGASADESSPSPERLKVRTGGCGHSDEIDYPKTHRISGILPFGHKDVTFVKITVLEAGGLQTLQRPPIDSTNRSKNCCVKVGEHLQKVGKGAGRYGDVLEYNT